MGTVQVAPLRATLLATLIAAACSLDSSGAPDGSTASSTATSGGGVASASSSNAGGGASASVASSSSAAGGSAGDAASSTASSSSGAGGSPPTPACTDPGGVCCGSSYCALGTSKCCVQQITMTYQCIAPADNCEVTFIEMPCDDSSDCPPSTVCCATWSGAVYTGLSCKDSCVTPGDGPTPGDYVQCIVGMLCPEGQVCNPDGSHFGPPHGYCNPP